MLTMDVMKCTNCSSDIDIGGIKEGTKIRCPVCRQLYEVSNPNTSAKYKPPVTTKNPTNPNGKRPTTYNNTVNGEKTKTGKVVNSYKNPPKIYYVVRGSIILLLLVLICTGIYLVVTMVNRERLIHNVKQSTFEANNIQLKSKMRDLKDTLYKNMSDYENLKQDYRSIKAENARLKQEKQSIRQELTSEKAAKNSLEAHLRDIEKTYTEAEKNIRNKDDTIDKLNVEISKGKSQIDETENQFREKLNIKDSKIVELETKVSNMGKTIKEYEDDYPYIVDGVKEPNIQRMGKKVNLNTATRDEILSLPRITETAVEMIIKQRPYRDKDDFKSKGIVSGRTYDIIKDVILVK